MWQDMATIVVANLASFTLGEFTPLGGMGGPPCRSRVSLTPPRPIWFYRDQISRSLSVPAMLDCRNL